MKKRITNDKKLFVSLIIAVAMFIILSPFILMNYNMAEHNRLMGANSDIEQFLSLRKDIQFELIHKGKFKCCLESPCTYCIVKHGECDCLEDIMTGKHPCGECIGEILEGHGNKLIAPYFATAIAEKIGSNHLEDLKQIISEKYDVPVEDQINVNEV